MRISSLIFCRIESSSKKRPDSERRKIICGNDAARSSLCAVTNIECRPGDLADDEGIDQLGISLQVEEVRVRNVVDIVLAANGLAQSHQAVLVPYHREGTEQNAFNPAENRGVRADPESQAQNYYKRKARAAAKHANPESKIAGEISEEI